MKNLIMLLTIFQLGLVANVYAADDLPNEAKPLYQIKIDRHGANSSALKNEIRSQIIEKDQTHNVDSKCSHVYYVWEDVSNTYCYRGTGWGPGGCFNPFNQLFGSSEFRTNKTVTLNVHCMERTFRQQMLVSLLNQCKISMTKECTNPEILDALNEILPTQRLWLEESQDNSGNYDRQD